MNRKDMLQILGQWETELVEGGGKKTDGIKKNKKSGESLEKQVGQHPRHAGFQGTGRIKKKKIKRRVQTLRGEGFCGVITPSRPWVSRQDPFRRKRRPPENQPRDEMKDTKG